MNRTGLGYVENLGVGDVLEPVLIEEQVIYIHRNVPGVLRKGIWAFERNLHPYTNIRSSELNPWRSQC